MLVSSVVVVVPFGFAVVFVKACPVVVVVIVVVGVEVACHSFLISSSVLALAVNVTQMLSISKVSISSRPLFDINLSWYSPSFSSFFIVYL